MTVELPALIEVPFVRDKLFAFKSIALFVEVIDTAVALVIFPVPAVERVTPPLPVIAPPNVMLLLSFARVKEPTVVEAFNVTAPALATLALPEVVVFKVKLDAAMLIVPAPPMLPLVVPMLIEFAVKVPLLCDMAPLVAVT